MSPASTSQVTATTQQAEHGLPRAQSPRTMLGERLVEWLQKEALTSSIWCMSLREQYAHVFCLCQYHNSSQSALSCKQGTQPYRQRILMCTRRHIRLAHSTVGRTTPLRSPLRFSGLNVLHQHCTPSFATRGHILGRTCSSAGGIRRWSGCSPIHAESVRLRRRHGFHPTPRRCRSLRAPGEPRETCITSRFGSE